MKHLITSIILCFSCALYAQQNMHLPCIENYYAQEIVFLQNNEHKTDSISPIQESLNKLEQLSQQSLIVRKIAQKAMQNIRDVYGIYKANVDSTAFFLNTFIENTAQTYSYQSPQYAEAVLWAAHECLRIGDQIQGKKLLNHSKKLFRKYGKGPFNGRDTLTEIFYLDIIAKMEYNAERDYEAIGLSHKSCKLKKLFFGQNSEVYFNALLDLSNLYAERHQYKKANFYHNLGYTAYVERIKSAFCQSSESERSVFWEKAKKYINKTITIAHKTSASSQSGNEHSLAAAAYNALLLSKGLLLNTSISFENFIINSGNEKAINILLQKKTLMTKQVTQSMLDSMDYAILDALKQNGQQFQLPHLSIRWQDVALQLEPNDLAIEFYKTEDDKYGAILLKKDWKSPKVINLSNKLKVSLQNKKTPLYDAMEQLNLEHYFPNQAQDFWMLSKAIWTDEIINYFPQNGQGRIFFSADGKLQMTGIEYLPFIKPEQNGNFYSMNDIYNIARLSSTRELITGNESTPHNTATLYGGIQYQMDSTQMFAESEKYPDLAVNRSLDADTLDRGGIKPLPGSKKEVEKIATLLQNNQLQAKLFTATNANEESFKALSGQHQNILHIATHGFFWTDSIARRKDYFAQNQSIEDNLNLPTTADPLNRCGLLFAGAQTAWSGHSAELPKGVQDGILTAKEISLLDLRDADLVVLSACETGKGEISGDGVFGLQRAFKQAGAQTIIMSLWPVNDAATQLLMTEFYKNWITNKQSKREAFRNAQNTVRENFEEPVYWAGFIMLD